MQAEPLSAAGGPEEEAGSSRERLLRAAADVFGRDGLRGATTREIARAAGVNEVTLFRRFGSKEKLLAAVLAEGLARQAAFLAAMPPWTGANLRGSLLAYARFYDGLLARREALARAFIGEGGTLSAEACAAARDAVEPSRAALAARLGEARAAGAIRGDLPLGPAAEAFRGMLLAGMLRRTLPLAAASVPVPAGGGLRPDPSPPGGAAPRDDEYLLTCVELFLRGIEPRPTPASASPAPPAVSPHPPAAAAVPRVRPRPCRRPPARPGRRLRGG